MDLSEVLSNPLFIPLLVASITIVGNACFLYWLRKWQYRAEYIVRNVENTYIPLVAEIHERLEYFNRFLESPTSLKYSFQTLESVKKKGLFEFIKSHDKKLYEKLILFYNQIYPKLEELVKFQDETNKAIFQEWVGYIEEVVSDKKAKDYSNSFVSELFRKGLFAYLLSGRKEEISKIWLESLYQTAQANKLYSPYLKPKDGHIVFSKGGKFPTFNVSQGDLTKLQELSQPKLQKLLDLYKQTKASVNDEVVKGLVPMMQKYITNPLS